MTSGVDEGVKIQGDINIAPYDGYSIVPPSMPPDEKKIQKLKIVLAIVFGSVIVLELGYIAALLHSIRNGY